MGISDCVIYEQFSSRIKEHNEALREDNALKKEASIDPHQVEVVRDRNKILVEAIKVLSEEQMKHSTECEVCKS
jgi:hypothetical protein